MIVKALGADRPRVGLLSIVWFGGLYNYYYNYYFTSTLSYIYIPGVLGVFGVVPLSKRRDARAKVKKGKEKKKKKEKVVDSGGELALSVHGHGRRPGNWRAVLGKR